MFLALIALLVIILLFSVIFHEVMHGWVALRFGDHTAERAGRLTLNPIPHIDPIGTIVVPALLMLSGNAPFGWAKPVPVNPLNFRDIKKGELMVSAAGVGANFLLAIIATIFYHLLNASVHQPVVSGILAFTVYINLILAVFNLLPVPPLDGSKVLLSQLPYNIARKYQEFEKYGFLVLIILVFLPFQGSSIIGIFLNFSVGILMNLFNIPRPFI